jgi:histidinol dehydrogenase
VIARLDAAQPDFASRFAALLAHADAGAADVDLEVAAILRAVRTRGDAALVEYTNRFDQRAITAAELEIAPRQVEAAAARVAPELMRALQFAAQRIRDFHTRQRAESWSFTDAEGSVMGQRVAPLERVGIYVPGGHAAYPTTVLMNAIPAAVAGVPNIVMAVPAPRGEFSDVVLAAARLAGVQRVFGIGGAQAIAALAFGTESVPAVDKIVGPGNRWVAAAKRQVFGTVGIDMIAGPSEVVIVSDGGGDAERVAMDLFAQAEHDQQARAILICTDAAFLDRVEQRLHALLPELRRADTIRAALAAHGALIRVADLDAAMDLANRLAPEHLELAVDEPAPLLERVRHAGAVFLGSAAAEVLGDYCAGPNHVLPTSRTARFSSPLGVYDFQKRISILECTPQGASMLGAVAAVLARAEGLDAHARAAELRVRKQNTP